MPIHLPPLNRRRFLAATLAAGAGAMLPRSLLAETASEDPNCFVLLSDIHIGESLDEEKHNLKPAQSFQQIVKDIVALPNRPPRAIVSGDCAIHHGRPGDYALLGELVKPLREAGLSMHFALGNHDHRQHFLAAFPDATPSPVSDKHVSVLETPHANWFLLDSLDKTASTPGLLGETQLAWLGKELDARADKPALILAHHNLNAAVQFKSLMDTRGLLKVLLPRKQVKAYFFGHTHSWGVGQPMGIHLVNVPTTAWPFEVIPNPVRGFVTARLRPDGAALTLHTLDHKHPRNRETVDLKWRA